MYPFALLTILLVPLLCGVTTGSELEVTRPPMGWISWDRFGCNRNCKQHPDDCIGERLVKRTADAMVNHGLRELGYRYVILDGCWHDGTRHPTSMRYGVSQEQFPNGVLSVSQYLQGLDMSLGLLFINPCSNKYTIDEDAKTANDYELGLMKIYTCSAISLSELNTRLTSYQRQIPVSCAGWSFTNLFNTNPEGIDWNTMQRVCLTFRPTGGSVNDWKSLLKLINIWIAQNDLIRSKSGPRHWIEGPTLTITQKGLSEPEKRTQMAMWCMLSFPLIFSEDIDELDHFASQLLMNKQLVDIDQDPNKPAKYLKTLFGIQVWARKLATRNQWAIALLNENTDQYTMMMKIAYSISDGAKLPFGLTEVFSGVEARDVDWNTPLKVTVPGHDTKVYLVQF